MHRIDRLAARVDLPLDGGHLALRLGQAAVQFFARDEGQILVGEIETGLDVGGQIEQVVAQPMQRACQSAGKLAQGGVEGGGAIGVDHAQHRFGLGQVDSPGQERPQRELARPGQSGAGGADGPQQHLHQRRRTDRVNLDDRLAGVAAPGPGIHVAGHGRVKLRQTQRSGDDAGRRTVGQTFLSAIGGLLPADKNVCPTGDPGKTLHRPWPADAHDAACRAPRRRGDRGDGVVEGKHGGIDDC